ncbi:hypothetical protein BJ138DRAFT_727718 [Hygrophoropsis aurantiaca]|uniref:Uncharacterized protein n=1 Tax=Hygrophoropsis aurantiaca TaxID=72124 RepID=A0ACB7ZY78_9AGAM|nr:hypothetical protein BJ138DRAFT_727718 [Hygrophoropsis aurantiaca]
MADPTIIQLQKIQTTNYLTAAAGTLVAYDHVLALSQEVDYIWNRKWSSTTALYLIARYSGTLTMMCLTAGHLYITWSYSVIVKMVLAVSWGQNIFLLAMQALLAIRVYALCHQSKKVLYFLLTFYILQAITVVVMTVLPFNTPTLQKSIVAIGPAIGSVEQNIDSVGPLFSPLILDSTFVSVVFDAALLAFALSAFMRHAFEAKTRDRRWSINVLVRTLVADHLLFFVCNLAWLVLSVAANYINELNFSLMTSLNAEDVFNALAVVVGPCMVISLRAMENKTREGGGTLGDKMSTMRFDVQERPTGTTQSQSALEEGGGFRAAEDSVQIDPRVF